MFVGQKMFLELFLSIPLKMKHKESIRVARALRKDLLGVRLDTPSQRGGVIPDLIKEARVRLDQAGFPYVKIFVFEGFSSERVSILSKEPVDAFGVGS